jgi:hypothetical protein
MKKANSILLALMIILLGDFAASGQCFLKSNPSPSINAPTPTLPLSMQNRDIICQYDSMHYYSDILSTGVHTDMQRQYFAYNESGLITKDSLIYMNNPSGNCTRFYYNETDQEITRIISQITDNVWQNYTKTETEYNNVNLVEVENVFWWNGEQWEISLKYEYAYDEVGNLTTRTHNLMTSNGWLIDGLEEFIYNSNGQIIEYTQSEWIDNDLEFNERVVQSFDNAGNRTLFEEYYFDGIEWIKQSRTEITYNAYDLPTNILYQIGEDNIWVNDSKELFGYNPNQTLSYRSRSEWSNNMWNADYYNAFSQGENNGNWTIVTWGYSTDNGTVLEDSSYIEVVGPINNWYSELPESIIIHENHYYMNAGSWALDEKNYNPICEDECYAMEIRETPVFILTRNYFCEGFVNIEEHSETDFSEIKVYPNPSFGTFNIDCRKQNQESEATIYDLNGKVVERKKINQFPYVWEAKLPSGFYYLRINHGENMDQETTVKIVVE